MNLKQIEISNYRSIEFLHFEIEKIADSNTYTLLGINESGKSRCNGQKEWYFSDDWFKWTKRMVFIFQCLLQIKNSESSLHDL